LVFFDFFCPCFFIYFPSFCICKRLSITRERLFIRHLALLALLRQEEGADAGAPASELRQHTSACVSMRQHTSAYGSIRQHASERPLSANTSSASLRAHEPQARKEPVANNPVLFI
jgi:hypothetical protein